MEPFYSLYRQKLAVYYESLIEEKEKKRMKMLQQLDKLDRKCGQEEPNFEVDGDRVIMVLNSEEQRQRILQKF